MKQIDRKKIGSLEDIVLILNSSPWWVDENGDEYSSIKHLVVDEEATTPTKTKFTIQDLSEGRVAIRNDGSLDDLRSIIALAFPDDEGVPSGLCSHYAKIENRHNRWVPYNALSKLDSLLPIQSVKDFFSF